MLTSAFLVAASCDGEEAPQAVEDPSSASSSTQFDAKEETTPDDDMLLLTQEDQIAWSNLGIKLVRSADAPEIPASVQQDLSERFGPVANAGRYAHEPIEVAYEGKVEFRDDFDPSSMDVGIDSYDDEMSERDEDHDDDMENEVIWVSYKTGNYYTVKYPEQEASRARGPLMVEPFDPGFDCPDKDMTQDLSATDYNYGSDSYGVIKGAESRYRVFKKNWKVRGIMYKPLLSIGGATGALIGRRHFMTAAHVVTKFDEKGKLVVNNPKVQVGRNGWRNIGMTARIEHLSFIKKWRKQYSSALKRRSVDFAWGVLNRRAKRCVGYYGYATMSQNTIEENDHPLTNIGYPSCKEGPSPNDCVGKHMYRDASNCDILDTARDDKHDWPRAISHNCDANPGHSGSPLLLTEDGKHYVWALHGGHIGSNNWASGMTSTRFRFLENMFDEFPRHK